MASLLVIVLVIPLVLRGYAHRVEADGGGVPDKVHRIRRAQMAAILALPVLEVAMLAEAYGEVSCWRAAAERAWARWPPPTALSSGPPSVLHTDAFAGSQEVAPTASPTATRRAPDEDRLPAHPRAGTLPGNRDP